MKKILIALPVILCIIISVCVPLASAAVYDVSELNFYSLEDFQKDYPLDEYDRYFYFYGQENRESTHTNSLYAPFNEQDATIDESSDSIIISFTEEQSLISCTYTWGSYDDYYHYSYYKIVYYPDTDEVYFYNNYNQIVFPISIGIEFIYLGLETNLKQASSLPDVVVRFNPHLSGEVSRIVENDDGTTSMLQELKMYITNNSNFSIQYKMSIYLSNSLTSRPHSAVSYDDLLEHYDDDPVFIYYSNSLVYDVAPTPSIDDMGDVGNAIIQDSLLFANSYNKASEWHKLEAHSNTSVTIPFSMINLVEGNTYNIKVEAYKLDYDIPSENFGYNNHSNHRLINPDNYCLAYDSNFMMLQYSDIKYDSSKTFGDVLPFNGSNGLDKYKYDNNYDAVTDLDGSTTIKHEDKLGELKQQYDKNLSSFSSSLDSNSFSQLTLDSFSGIFSNVFGFVSMFLSFLPSSILYIFIFGFSTIVIIAIFRAVR